MGKSVASRKGKVSDGIDELWVLKVWLHANARMLCNVRSLDPK